MKVNIHYCEWLGEGIAEVYSKEIEIGSGSVDVFVKEMQKLVGGYFEIVRHAGKLLYVDEEGLLKRKPLNPWAMQRGLKLVGTVVEVSEEVA